MPINRTSEIAVTSMTDPRCPLLFVLNMKLLLPLYCSTFNSSGETGFWHYDKHLRRLRENAGALE
jgi:hypothetical protein